MSDKTPTPLERLEAWRKGSQRRSVSIYSVDDKHWVVELHEFGTCVHYNKTASLTAAILAALAQAEGGTHE